MIIRANSRSPDRYGRYQRSIRLRMARFGTIRELVGKYGRRQTIDQAIVQRIANVEQIIRREFVLWEDGHASGDRLLDDDGVRVGKPIQIAVTVHKNHDHIVFDFSESDDQAVGPANIRPSLVKAACGYVVISSLGKDITTNQGVLNSIEIRTRPGSILEPELPAPMNTYNPTVHAVINAKFRCPGPVD